MTDPPSPPSDNPKQDNPEDAPSHTSLDAESRHRDLMQEMAETPVYSFDVTIEVSEDSVAVRFPFRSGTGAKQTRGTVTSFSMKPVIDKMDRDKNARDGKSKDVTDGTGKEATDDGGTGKEVTDDGGTGKEVTDGGEPFAQDVVHQRTVPGESATDGPDDSIM